MMVSRGIFLGFFVREGWLPFFAPYFALFILSPDPYSLVTFTFEILSDSQLTFTDCEKSSRLAGFTLPIDTHMLARRSTGHPWVVAPYKGKNQMEEWEGGKEGKNAEFGK